MNKNDQIPSPDIQVAIKLLASAGYIVTKVTDLGVEIQQLRERISCINQQIDEPVWGIQDEDALAVERAILRERRNNLQQKLDSKLLDWYKRP